MTGTIVELAIGLPIALLIGVAAAAISFRIQWGKWWWNR